MLGTVFLKNWVVSCVGYVGSHIALDGLHLSQTGLDRFLVTKQVMYQNESCIIDNALIM